MQIGSYTPLFSLPLEMRSQMTGTAKAASKNKAPEKEDFSSHFSSPDDVTAGRDSKGRVYYQSASPYIRLMEQYDRWKAQLPEQEAAALPDSTGLTEDNIAYLKDRYSGELTWMEREDALDTMVKMGIINNQQKFSAHGGSLSSLAAGSFAIAGGTEPIEVNLDAEIQNDFNRYDPLERDWNVLFEDTPIVGFSTIDDILRWVKSLSETTADPLRCRVFDVSMDASMMGIVTSK